MEIGPIFRSMARNKIGVGLLMLEVAVTLAIVMNCAGMVWTHSKRLSRETGIDEEHLILVRNSTFGEKYRDRHYRRQMIAQDLTKIRATPGVLSASVIGPVPLASGGSSTMARPLGKELRDGIRGPIYWADTKFIDSLGLELVEGRAFQQSDMHVADGPFKANVIVTRDMANALFPDGDALGKEILTGGGHYTDYPDTIVGIVDHMFTPFGGSAMETRIIFFPDDYADEGYFTYLVRVDKASYDALFASLPDLVLAQQADRVVTTRSMTEVKSGGLLFERMMVQLLVTVMLLLLFVTGVGLAGMTAFAVARRTKQIGIRRALGAKKWDVLRYFLVENGMVIGGGLALGICGGIAFNRLLVAHADVDPLPFSLSIGCMLVLIVFGLLATLFPALRGTKIEPAIATRSV